MKVTIVPAAALAAALRVSAQSSSADEVTVTEYYDDCTTSGGPEYTGTVTGTIVSTYCPKCTESMISSALSLSPSGSVAAPLAGPYGSPSERGILSTYTTVYSQLCSTGIEPVTYTVTESCSSLGASRESSYVPQGFVVTTVECHICQEGSTVVITTPISTPSTAPLASSPSAGPAISTGPALASGSPAMGYAAPVGTPATTIPVVTGTITVQSSPAATGAPPASDAGGIPSVASPGVGEVPSAVAPGASETAPYSAPATGPSGPPVGTTNTTIKPPINYASGSASKSATLVSIFVAIAIYGAFQLAM